MSLSAIILVSCGNFEASQHPDDFFRDGRGIASLDDLDGFVNSGHMNPLYREAEVTTVSGPLRLKTEPNSSAPSPSSGERQLQKGAKVYVYWPTDVNNNHIKIFHNNQTLWVTFKSSSGRQYVTLIQDLALPTVTTPGSGIVTIPSRPPVGGGDLVTTPSLGNTLAERTIRLTSSAITEAHAAIRAVSLAPAEVASCQFDPLIGNNSSFSNCYEKIVISRAFRDFIANHGHACAQSAAQTTFGQRPQKILFHTSGAGQVSRHRKVSGTGKKSMHATGQAFDLFAVTLQFSGNRTRKVVLHKNHTDGSDALERENHGFYWSYVNCWKERVRKHSSCNCSASKSGTITYLDNSAHHNHIHMSLPFCERSRFNVSCV